MKITSWIGLVFRRNKGLRNIWNPKTLITIMLFVSECVYQIEVGSFAGWIPAEKDADGAGKAHREQHAERRK